jgi:hypothetical protein
MPIQALLLYSSKHLLNMWYYHSLMFTFIFEILISLFFINLFWERFSLCPWAWSKIYNLNLGLQACEPIQITFSIITESFFFQWWDGTQGFTLDKQVLCQRVSVFFLDPAIKLNIIFIYYCILWKI